MFHEIAQMIERELPSRSTPAIGVGVARRGEILWQTAYGWRSREERSPADEHTMFSIASTSKPFTATAIMILHEEGKLDVDAPANEYLGDAQLRSPAGNAADITIRSIMSHTSGLPDYVQFFYADEPHRVPSMADTIRHYGFAIDRPGARARYTNLGYGTLNHLVERVSGQSFPDFLRRRVFHPLGMNRSDVGTEPSLAPYRTERYWPDGSRIPFYTFDHLGGSAIFASVHDLLRFGLFHLGEPLADQHSVLSPESREEMQLMRGTIQDQLYTGSGWWVRDDGEGHRIVEHTGGMPGVGSDFVMIPDLGLVITAVVNGDSGGLKAVVTHELLRRLAPDYAHLKPPVWDPPESGPGEELAPLHGEWRGTIAAADHEISFGLSVTGCGHVIASIGDQPAALVDAPVYQGSRLRGKLHGWLDTPDTARSRHTLSLDLLRNDDTLTGSVSAVAVPANGRPYFALPHWTELRRVEGA